MNFAGQYNLPGTFAPIASYELLSKAVFEAQRIGAVYRVGNVYSTDTFYNALGAKYPWESWTNMGVLAVEMETAALYMTAAFCGKNALALCTISDSIVTGEECTPQERQNTFCQMMEIELNIA